MKIGDKARIINVSDCHPDWHPCLGDEVVILGLPGQWTGSLQYHYEISRPAHMVVDGAHRHALLGWRLAPLTDESFQRFMTKITFIETPLVMCARSLDTTGAK